MKSVGARIIKLFQFLIFLLTLTVAQLALAQVQQSTPAKIDTATPAKTPTAAAPKADTEFKLDKTILVDEDKEQINSLFKDMIVVQRRAITRENKILADTSFNFDYSDYPRTMYALGLGAGYALSESIEIHGVLHPVYVSNEKPIAQSVRSLQLLDETQAELLAAKPVLGFESHLIWVLAYGKDAWGPFDLVRSDTFMKFLLGAIKYDGGKTGLKFGAMFGKTLFFSRHFNVRLSVGLSSVERYINDQKQSSIVGNLEPALFWYF